MLIHFVYVFLNNLERLCHLSLRVMNIHERTRQIMSIFHQLQEMNLGIMGYEEFDQFKTICNAFIRTGEPTQGNIPVCGAKRIIHNHFNDNAVAV